MSDVSEKGAKASPWSVIAILIAAVALVVSLTGRSQELPGQSSTLDRILREEVIRAGYIIYPPTVDYGDGPETPTGFMTDIMNEIATRAGIVVRYEETSFDNIRTGLSTHRWDVVVGGVFKTIPRALSIAAPRPIMYWAGTTGVIRAGEHRRFGNMDSLNQQNIVVAVTNGTAEHEWVTANLPDADVRALPNDDISLTLVEVTAGRADVAFADAVTVRNFVSRTPNVIPLLEGRQFNSYAVSFALRKEDTDLLRFFDAAIDVLHVDGTIAELSKQYGGDAIWDLPRDFRQNEPSLR